ncbi:MAG: HAD hydrolase family protein [Oscillospiraceae bacterium]|nr:HAD hydrolase family protein [Oscillospiraceae bacterium]
MAKFSDVFFASDFDHTLTGQDNVLRERNVEAIKYFIAEGGRFAVASGRSIPLFRKRAALVPVNAPCILYNGGACYDYASETLYYAHPLPDFAMEIVREAQRLDPSLCIEVQGVENHYVFGRNPIRDAFLKGEGFTPVLVTDAVPKPWIKIAVCAGLSTDSPTPVFTAEDAVRFAEVERGLRDFCAGRCYVTRSMAYILEIGNPACSKGGAARALADRFERSILVCAGDAPNDISMLDAADFAFVPSDCDPALRDKPYHRTVSCNDGAVAAAIERLDKLLHG